MKLNFAEQLLVNNAARAMVQRFYEGPLLHELGGPVKGAKCWKSVVDEGWELR